jgi:hypothetical protein
MIVQHHFAGSPSGPLGWQKKRKPNQGATEPTRCGVSIFELVVIESFISSAEERPRRVADRRRSPKIPLAQLSREAEALQ